MPDAQSPSDRSIGLAGVIHFLIAVGAAIAIGSAFKSGSVLLGSVGVVFFLGASALAYRSWRARRQST